MRVKIFTEGEAKTIKLEKNPHALGQGCGSILVEVAPQLASYEFDIPLWTMPQFAAKKKFHIVQCPGQRGPLCLFENLEKDCQWKM